MTILVINSGSSSVKCAVLEPHNGEAVVTMLAERLEQPEASLSWTVQQTRHSQALPNADHQHTLYAIGELLRSLGLIEPLTGVGHRVVHGGESFSASVLITEEVLAQITHCTELSPLHNPPNILGIRIMRGLFPRLPQVAVFDTAFHHTMPARAYRYAVPQEWFSTHRVRRYGFHGTSHRFVAQQAVARLELLPHRHALITAHLGNGCSCAAIADGRCLDTTMGMTPLEGLVMGTRSGSLDPAIIAHMARTLHQSADAIIETLNKKSGLLGLSGLSNDMRTLLNARDQGHEQAALAVDVFCYVLAKTIAGLVVPLGRLDALIFTGGIGEHAAAVRAQVVQHLAFLGLTLDAAANAVHGAHQQGRISSSGPAVLVIPTNEELLIASDTLALTAQPATSLR